MNDGTELLWWIGNLELCGVLLQETFERNGAKRFWRHFDAYTHVEVMEMSKSPVRMHGILEFWCFCHVV